MNILLTGKFNQIIERTVTASIGHPFRIIKIEVIKTDAMHDTAIFCGEDFKVFVKAGTNSFSWEQFSVEAWELEYIRQHSGVKSPAVIDVVREENIVLLILEAIEVIEPRTKHDWENLGRGLAILHQTHNNQCGLDRPTYLGTFKQNNTFKNTWHEFFGECRLHDFMKMAVDAGNMNSAQCAVIEKLITRLPELCPPQTSFSLLHGDPWIGNLLYNGKELVAIDCSIYYGNREIDLTTVDFFCPVPSYFFAAYHEVYPIESGFEERKDLWRTIQWLGLVTLSGDEYMGKLMDAANKYL